MGSYIGVDVGVRGGIAVLSGGGDVLDVYPLSPKMTREQLVNLVNLTVTEYAPVDLCCIERVQYMRGDGGQGSFTFGRVAGLLEGMFAMARIALASVPPAVWQGRMGCLTGGDKNVSKRRAKELFPALRAADITHATADALLIAEYGRRVSLRLGPPRA